MKTLVRGLATALALIVVLAAIGWLLLQRPDIPYAALEARYGYADSQYVDLPGGVRAHYRDVGPREAPAIVLIHGFAASTHAWDEWVKALSTDYRVVVLDLPGHGLTRTGAAYVARPDGYEAVVDDLTRRLGLSRFTLGGNSMGGEVAWTYALDHSDRVERLILVDAAGWPTPGRGGGMIFKFLGNPVGRRVLKDIEIRPLMAQALRSAYVDPKLVTPALVERYVDLARGPGHRDILLGQRPRRAATAADLARIHVATLIMFGQDDRLIPAADGEQFHKAIPAATLILYPGVGHLPMEQIPQRSADDLKAWLAAHPAPAEP
ncbi:MULTISPECIES: alpha/beta fold hydrolase [unclassified Caulobacter]|uniref:alpha/beta fold hydrolase n=1 Tax=unclassified Caulobacter TaxID=2648921 RepID=UPI0006FA27D0|nr:MULTISPECIES: alpha/beta hydrolase [unclassified Caulobacter]KQV62171.1 alpha/beta hydrolase [Caulobacter sp. Root342]KQV63091.1 alpha/beta hydrolase [Caulobacter sp. Root343]